ncbi:MAG: DUF2191 domain-containing protein [Acidobacteriota bacterium]
MGQVQRTTVRLDEALLAQAKREAAKRGSTLTDLIDEGLRLVLASSKPGQENRTIKLPVCRAGGGLLPGVDLNDSAALLDLMENRG